MYILIFMIQKKKIVKKVDTFPGVVVLGLACMEDVAFTSNTIPPMTTGCTVHFLA